MLKYTTRNYFFNFLIAFPLKEQKSAKLHKARISQSKFFFINVVYFNLKLELRSLTFSKGFNWSNHIPQSNNLVRITIRRGQNMNIWGR